MVIYYLDFGIVLNENDGLRKIMDSLELPTRKHVTIESDGISKFLFLLKIKEYS